jgi:hypothetical protein
LSRRDKPSLEDLQRDLLHQTRELHRALIAPEGSIEARLGEHTGAGGLGGRARQSAAQFVRELQFRPTPFLDPGSQAAGCRLTVLSRQLPSPGGWGRPR